MLHNPTLEKLQALKFTGMLRALEEQMQMPDCESLGFEERLGLLIDREMAERDSRRLKTRLRKANFRLPAAVEDIDWRARRGLDKSMILSLAGCRWIAEHHNCIITGPTGAGKSYIACALGNKACREGYSVLYFRVSRLFAQLAVARADGRYLKILNTYAKTDLLIFDDWGTESLSEQQRRDLFEIVEDRYACRSTLVAGQLPVKHWHEVIGDATLADAILDRLVHNAYKITLKGESMRKKGKVCSNKN